MDKKATVVVSGGFDPIHIGHVRMIQEAATHGDVIVILNSDDWLMRKKGYVFMPWEQRAEILWAIFGVNTVVAVDDSDGTVLKGLQNTKPDFFANGGDRKMENTPEVTYCLDNDIRLLWNIGGEKIANSSDLVEKVADYIHESDNEITELWVEKNG